MKEKFPSLIEWKRKYREESNFRLKRLKSVHSERKKHHPIWTYRRGDNIEIKGRRKIEWKITGH